MIAALLALADNWENSATSPAEDVPGGLELDITKLECAHDLRRLAAVVVMLGFFGGAR